MSLITQFASCACSSVPNVRCTLGKLGMAVALLGCGLHLLSAVPLRDWIAVVLNWMLDKEELAITDRFSCLDSCVTKG